ncbi:hypothetical protein [Nocardioides gilvus]|uniref:hypothetical protein n=1 Tax=Nocardioides gilvus TaxID=1735589 RepID=UPI000D74C473|nr:hypothetical protein [Nocardioides gilvus]
MGTSLNSSTEGASSQPTWARALLLVVGVAVSAAAGYVAAMAVMVLAVILGAAPLGIGDSATQQPWVTPVAVGTGLVVFGLGLRFCVLKVRRRPPAS